MRDRLNAYRAMLKAYPIRISQDGIDFHTTGSPAKTVWTKLTTESVIIASRVRSFLFVTMLFAIIGAGFLNEIVKEHPLRNLNSSPHLDGRALTCLFWQPKRRLWGTSRIQTPFYRLFI